MYRVAVPALDLVPCPEEGDVPLERTAEDLLERHPDEDREIEPVA